MDGQSLFVSDTLMIDRIYRMNRIYGMRMDSTFEVESISKTNIYLRIARGT
jgi:hypothetical protein